MQQLCTVNLYYVNRVRTALPATCPPLSTFCPGNTRTDLMPRRISTGSAYHANTLAVVVPIVIVIVVFITGAGELRTPPTID